MFNIERAWGLLGNQAYVAFRLGDLDWAAKTLLDVANYFRTRGGKGNMTTSLVRLAQVERERNNLDLARSYASEAKHWATKLNMHVEQQQANMLLAVLEKLG